MEFPLLESLAPDDRRELLSNARRRKFRRGDVIFHEGDPGDSLHLIDKGHVAARVTTPLGDVATLLVMGPGSFFGELAIVSPAPRNSTVVALDAVETLSLHRDTIAEARERHRAMDQVLLDALVAEVRRISHQLLEALYVPVDKRVVRRLLDLVEVFDPDDAGVTTVPLTQEDIAQLAGTTRPSANKVLKALEERGAITVARGRIEITDASALARRGR
jgi:CRP/FNR family transcriptional regulator, cyclic AMP receptor protein